MNEKLLRQREELLVKRGYVEAPSTTSTNSYSWLKTIYSDSGDRLYTIEWRVWDWEICPSKIIDNKKIPYTMELRVIVYLHNGCKAVVNYHEFISIQQAEVLAKEVYDLSLRYKFNPAEYE